MRRTLIFFTLILGLGFAQQGQFFGEAVFGELSLVPNLSLDLQVAAGVAQAFPPLDLRFAAGIRSSAIGSQFRILADALLPLPFGLEPGRLDVGLGLGLQGTPANASFVLRALLGLEVPLQGSLNLRAEPTLTYDFAGGRLGLGILVGPRVYLR